MILRCILSIRRHIAEALIIKCKIGRPPNHLLCTWAKIYHRHFALNIIKINEIRIYYIIIFHFRNSMNGKICTRFARLWENLRTNNRIYFNIQPRSHNRKSYFFICKNIKLYLLTSFICFLSFSQTKCHEIYPVYTAYFHFRAQNAWRIVAICYNIRRLKNSSYQQVSSHKI